MDLNKLIDFKLLHVELNQLRSLSHNWHRPVFNISIFSHPGVDVCFNPLSENRHQTINRTHSLNDLNKRNNASVPTLTSTATTMTSAPTQAAVMPGAESFRTSANQSTVNVGWLVGTTSR